MLQKILNSHHHAFAVVGEPTSVMAYLQAGLPSNTPDVWCEMFNDFTVDDSRKAKSWQATKPLAGSYKYAVWGIASANTEAQNALLKTLEEPSAQVKIIMVIPHTGVFLPTVLSRLMVLHSEGDKIDGAQKILAEKFITAQPHERLALLAENFMYDDDHIKSKLIYLLSACEIVIQEKLASGEGVSATTRVLIEAKKQLGSRSAVPRLVMEHIAVVL